MKTVSCPTCKKSVPWTDANPWRPFCSERCRLIDLGDWIEERNRIPDTPSQENPASGRMESEHSD